MSQKIRGKSVETSQNSPQPKDVKEGDVAPAFAISSDDGRLITNGDFAARRLVIFFYPKAGTEGCTQEATAFSQLAPDFAALGTDVLGVSADTPKALQKFRAKHALTVLLGSDEDHRMLEAFGIWTEKKMYGRTFMGIVRSTFLIEADGRIGKIWRNVRVKDHAEAVLAALKS